MAGKSPLPTIAVVAVHGVGDHVRGASARAVADLLLRLRYPGGTARYTSFQDEPLRIPVRPPNLGPAVEAPAPEHALMREQLERYLSTGAPYDTLRIEGERLSAPAPGASARPVAAVHVYEMYWSDLSRVGASALRVFGEMYQMLFHLAVLGSLALRDAAVDLPEGSAAARRWKRHAILHGWAVSLLTSFVPVTWLIMLATVLGFIVLRAPTGVKSVVLGVAAGAVVAGALWRLVYRSRMLWSRLAAWLAIPLVGVAIGFAAWGAARAEEHGPHRDAFLVAVWLLVAAFALRAIFRAYDSVCPGALRAGRWAFWGAVLALALSVARFATDAFGEEDYHRLGNAIVNAFELETLGVVVIWYLLYGFAAAAALLGQRAIAAHPDDAARKRLRRALWTARATLAISASSVLVFTFVLWAAILRSSTAMLPKAETPIAIWQPFQAETYEALFHRVIQVTAGAGFPLLLLILCTLVVTAALALLPAAAREVWAPRVGARFEARTGTFPTSGDPDAWARFDEEARGAERLGEWLTKGYERLGLAILTLFVATFVINPLASLLGWLMPPAALAPGALIRLFAVGLDGLQSEGHAIVALAGSALAATAVGLLALRGRLQRLALGFRPVLDAALDVDNYLRQHPRENTPRARIAERYASLLRYLGHWRSDDGAPYKAIVFVTHSQGTVITAETLGFASREPDPELEAILPRDHRSPRMRADRRLYLFTMGSPLRQLYAQCFPHLFGWLHDLPRPWGQPSNAASPPRVTRAAGSASSGGAPTVTSQDGHWVTAPPIPGTASPDPYDFGLVRWVNAYRSGDYVGRAIWRTETPGCTWVYRPAPDDAPARCPGAVAPLVFVSEDGDGSRRELCIGIGAHTHYWDDTARAVAVELDMLLADAAAAIVPAAPASTSTSDVLA